MKKDSHRHPTTLGVDATLIQQEVTIANETKKHRLVERRRRMCRVAFNCFIIFGVVYGYLALGVRLWQKMHGR